MTVNGSDKKRGKLEGLSLISGDLANIDVTTLIAHPNDEYGNALTLKSIDDGIKYNQAMGWMVWNGKYWENDQIHLVKQKVAQMILMRAEAGKEAGIKQLSSLRPTIRIVNNCVQTLEYMSDIRADISEFDKHRFLLNCSNGIINLKNSKLIPHDKSFMITHMIPVEYNTDAIWLDWDNFFDQTVGENKEYLQIAAGYSLTAETSEEIMFYVYGPSRSGKGTFTEAFLKLLPAPMGYETDFNTFTRDRSNDPNNFDLAPLKSSRLVIASESERNDRLNPAKIKILTGGNDVYCSFKNRTHFAYKPLYKIWLVSNHKINADAEDDAIWGRIRLISFPNSNLGKEDRNLKNKLHSKENLEGLLAWAVQGSRKWYDLNGAGISIPEDMSEMRAEMRADSDTIGYWIIDAVDLGPNKVQSIAKLYENYREWCKEGGFKARNKTNFVSGLTRREGIKNPGKAVRVNGKSSRVLFGLDLKSDFF